MNKIFKVVIKNDPIFKYIVEDYPFYEGIFFHSVDFYSMNILKTHYLLRRNLLINMGEINNLYRQKYKLRLDTNIDIKPAQIKINIKSLVKLRPQISIINSLKTNLKSQLKLSIKHRDYSKSTVNIHMIKLLRLKTHDPYALENRDLLTLSNMDGEKIL